MKPKFYQLLEKCISDGIENGIYRYNKHTDQPLTVPDNLKEQIAASISNELSQWFTFTDEDLGVTN